jgi:hypothetical protein
MNFIKINQNIPKILKNLGIKSPGAERLAPGDTPQRPKNYQMLLTAFARRLKVTAR